MTSFKCRIADSSGRIKESVRFAPDKNALIKQINDEKLFLVSFVEDKSRKKRRYSKKIILDFTDTMSLMLGSGLSIKDALTVASSTFSDKRTGELVNSLLSSLNKGISFPDVINQMDKDFPPLYRGMVKIGDSTGSMDNIFGKLSNYLNDEKKMREKIQGALMYPLLVLVVMFLGMFAVFFFIFPKIRQSFAADTLDLVFERFQLMMTGVMVPSVLLVVFAIFLLIASMTGNRLKSTADAVILKIPVLGKIGLIRSSLNIMFSLEVLSHSGYPLEAAISESTSVLSNSVLKNALLRIKEAIIRGDKLSSAFRGEKVFPDRISVWIGVGEASGDVSRVFAQLRTYFQGEMDKMTSRIMLLIEPVLIVTVGVFMILFVVLFVVPLFGIFGAVL